jgi:glyoxylase-like metal-dependent hydrolase (beta-lactamase superfamily II)
VHAYLLRDAAGRWVLVDGGAGTPEAWAALRDGVAVVAGGVDAIAVHVVTHMHLDHIGLVHPVQEESRARLVMHRLDAERSAHAHAQPDEEAEYRAALLRDNGAPDEVRGVAERGRAQAAGLAPWIPPHEVLEGPAGPLPGVKGWSWLWTPGHTAGHISLVRDADGVVVAGDAVLPRITPTIGVNRQRPDPVGDYLQALDRLEQVLPRLLLPGHGEPVASPLHRIRELREETTAEGQRILRLLGATGTSAWEVALRRHPSADLPVAMRMLALRETRAHLDRLASAGQAVRARSADGVWRFGRA